MFNKTKRDFFKDFKYRNKKSVFACNEISFPIKISIFAYFEYFLTSLVFLFICYWQFNYIKNFQNLNLKLKLGDKLFTILFINGYVPISLYKFFSFYLKEEVYLNSYEILTDSNNSNSLIKLYRYHTKRFFPKSKVFINRTNLILSRYYSKNIYD